MKTIMIQNNNYLFFRICFFSSALVLLQSCFQKRFKIETEDMLETMPVATLCEYNKYKSYKSNDLVIVRYYNRYFKREVEGILRVVGRPGDLVEIRNGEILVNNKQFDLPQSAVLNYKLYFRNGDSSFLKQTTYTTLMDLKKENKLDSFARSGFSQSELQETIIGSAEMGWNMDHFGPVKVKTEGEEIKHHPENLYYGNEVNDDFYFLVADNFYRSVDSRIIGLIPKKCILGKIISYRPIERKIVKINAD